MTDTDTITANTLAWARSHDWGRDAEMIDGKLTGLVDRTITSDGRLIETTAAFTSRRAVREWAGY